MRSRPGSPAPLGASWDGEGTNFALYSEGATGVELVLVDRDRRETRIAVRQRTDFVWHVYVEGVMPGQLYGYYVDGPWEPQAGLRFNKQSRLLDPWALAVAGVEDWDAGAFSYDMNHADKDLVKNEAEQRAAPLGIVIDRRFDWEDDKAPNIPLSDAILYEAHVKGLTQQHPHVPGALRGTYGGIATDAIVNYLRELGVTSLELLPIHHFVDDKFLLDKGLRNYWGYNTIAFFAPDPRYRAEGPPGNEVREFKQMVKRLHAAGIEVILDVVYNHTAEGNHMGPTFSLKGIDNRTYYRLVPDSPRHYFDYTGTGNSLNVRHPQALRLVMDSLRYWVEEMHVDGFRFDLASTLARSLHEVDRLSSFFTIINQDPVISRVKLIAEPWDVGEGGYQVGGFPVGWSEWNGKYRDALREFWRGDSGKASEVGYRISGSADLYQNDGRTPSSSINLITAHDGFTLRDLVSYNHKHNEANGENNQDGSNNDGSWNCGHEGETDDPEIVRLRWRQIRNFLGTLLLSQGTPMIVGGDELGRTQRGNNNAYCQDNELSWFDWRLTDEQRALLDFTKRAIRIRREHPTFRRAGFFRGRPVRGADVHDIVWLRHDGEPMGDAEWQDPMTSSFAMYVAGSGVDRVDERGRPMADDDFLLAMNASSTDLNLQLPVLGDRAASQPWELVIDTCDDHARETKNAGETTPLRARSLKVYSRAAASKASIQSVTGAPVSTYRLQLHKDFTFAQAADIIGYLAGLGVAAIYTSPYTHAEQGSTHGYNVVDHAALNPELGPDDHVRFVDAIQQHQLGHVLDFVPNHVGIGSGENTWWIDVLENGPASLYADYFDIDWRPPTLGLTNKLLLPTLGKQFGEALEAGELSVVRDGGRFFVAYYDRRWPVAPRTYRAVLHLALDALELPKLDPARQELESILFALDHIPEASQTEESKREERAREKEIVKRRVAELCNTSDVVRETIDRVLAAKNPKDGATGDIEWLEAFLRDQNYRLAYWRVATEEINYRRFFDINELAAIRMEDPRVFDATHALVLDLVARGAVTGLRLDHTDGLYEPAAYFRKLQSALRDALRKAGKQPKGHVYVVAEKILEPGEELPRSWDIAGTSGYDFIAAINGLWVDPCAEEPMTELYARLTGITTDFAEMVYDAKRLIMETSLSSETIMLGQALRRISESGRRSRDFTLTALTTAITDTIAAFPVYRSYVAPDGSREPRDERHIAHAIDLAKAKRRGTIDPSVYDYLHDVLTLRVRSPEAIHFAMRFQQLTGPVMAKGIEDTAMYRYYRLISNNEVGCDPAGFAGSPAQFHAHNAEMLAAFPLTMTTTTTHDTKRSEDVRTRIAALSEIVEEWATTSTQWIERLANAGASPNDVYLLVQTVIGAWPFAGEDPTLQERVSAYMVKAAREAKLHTSWTRPDAGYEQALAATVAQLFHDEALLGEVARLARRLAPAGACNSIAQVALKLASPGVADTYQGTELWDLSLVDPDNRRPVDYESRRALASALAKAGTPSPDLARELVDTYADGRIKLHVTRTGLAMRRADPLLFLEGGYRPLDAGEHVVAFERSRSDQRLVCIVPRLPIKLSRGTADWPLGSVWENHTITLGAGTRWRNAFTGEQHEGSSLALADVLATFPVAWLVSS